MTPCPRSFYFSTDPVLEHCLLLLTLKAKYFEFNHDLSSQIISIITYNPAILTLYRLMFETADTFNVFFSCKCSLLIPAHRLDLLFGHSQFRTLFTSQVMKLMTQLAVRLLRSYVLSNRLAVEESRPWVQSPRMETVGRRKQHRELIFIVLHWRVILTLTSAELLTIYIPAHDYVYCRYCICNACSWPCLLRLLLLLTLFTVPPRDCVVFPAPIFTAPTNDCVLLRMLPTLFTVPAHDWLLRLLLTLFTGVCCWLCL